MFRTFNRASSWTASSPSLINSSSSGDLGTISAIAVSAIDTNIVYAGTDDGNVWVTKDGCKNWNKVSTNLPERWVTAVTTDPTDANTAYVSYSGYRWNDHIKQVYMTTDAGQTWKPIGGNLPDVPVNDIIADPKVSKTLFAATDVGVYYTRDLGANWQLMGDGLPKAPSLDLCLHNTSRTLLVGTFGRGMYKLDLKAFDASSPVENTVAANNISLTAFPNPFKEQVNITFNLKELNNDVTITVCDVAGKYVITLHKGKLMAGNHTFVWKGISEAGNTVAPGIYMVQLKSNGISAVQKIVFN